MAQITEQIPELDEDKIPVEGQPSSIFRANAGYVWGKLREICLSLNIANSQIDTVAQQVNTNAQQVAINRTYVEESRNVIEQTMASMPDGSINDTTPSTTSVYSSSKTNELLDGKSGTGHTHTASQVGAYSTQEVDDLITLINQALAQKAASNHDHDLKTINNQTIKGIGNILIESGLSVDAVSLTSNGYIKFSNGFTIQWGNTGNNAGTVYYPTPFTNNVLCVIPNIQYNGGCFSGFHTYVTSQDKNRFTLSSPHRSVHVHWIAIGN